MGYMEQKTKMDRLLLPHNIRKCINLVVDFHTVYVSPTGWHFSFSASILGSVDKYWGHRNKKHKKQPFSDASASHLSLMLWHV